MRGIIGVIVGVLIVVLVIVGLISLRDDGSEKSAEGKIYFGITDDTADISSVNEISLNVEKVEVYSALNGWVEVGSDSKAYALLSLKSSGSVQLYNVSEVSAGTYDKVKVTLGKVTVDSKTQGNVDAVVPSSVVTFDVDVIVDAEKDTHVTLDFLADKSLHVTKNGGFVFAPVVAVESRSSTTVEVNEQSKVITVIGGTVAANVTVGMDLTGTTKSGFVLDSSKGLDIVATTTGETSFMLGGETFMKAVTTEVMMENDIKMEGGSTSTDSMKVKSDSMIKTDVGKMEAKDEVDIEI